MPLLVGAPSVVLPPVKLALPATTCAPPSTDLAGPLKIAAPAPITAPPLTLRLTPAAISTVVGAYTSVAAPLSETLPVADSVTVPLVPAVPDATTGAVTAKSPVWAMFTVPVAAP